jgi:hypothetical protein
MLQMAAISLCLKTVGVSVLPPLIRLSQGKPIRWDFRVKNLKAGEAAGALGVRRNAAYCNTAKS